MTDLGDALPLFAFFALGLYVLARRRAQRKHHS